MQIATALFFETPEQIFVRVFTELKPRTPVPPVSIEFCPFANPNSLIQLKHGGVRVRITDLLEQAPAPILESLAWVLFSKLYRKPVPGDELLRYRRYLSRKDMRDKIHNMRQERGRKLVAPAKGGVYDLDEVFDRLNFEYFFGLMSKPAIGWSRRASRSILGHYDPSHHTIVVSKLLDSPRVPPFVVDYVMFHEMLHIKFPTEHRTARRCVHTQAFKQAEKQFSHYKEARETLKHL
jgi:hypothetical protein